MTRYSSTMTEALQEIREGFSPKQIKMAIGIAADPRYKGGNYSGAYKQIEKIKKGLADHPQVAAVLKRLNTDFDPEMVEDWEDVSENSFDLTELAMPRRDFDKLKKGDKITITYDSSIKKGHVTTFEVKGRSRSAKYKVDKITMQPEGAPSGRMKYYLYSRDGGDATLAMGDMGASMTKIKMEGLSEGTWAVPDSPKAKAELKKLMSKPIKLGKEGDDATDLMYSLIGDDELFDDLYVAGKKNPNGDARPIIKKAMKRLGIKEEVGLKEAALAIAEKLKVSDGVGAWIKDFQKSDAPQFQGKSEEDRKKMALAAFADAGGKLEETELDEGRMKELHGYIEKGMSAQEIAKKMKLDVKTIKSLMDETELDEAKEPFAVVDTADGNKVVGTASDEKGAKSIITTSQLPPMKIKDKKTLKIVKVKKKQMIGQPIKEEEGPDNRPDSAKEVEQGRDDKKKTRIAQLQLQIAKAQETINKLNAQEKPNG